mmetsp:Transcript_14338/g.33378  ORF Transcript_14338/g.33378 Transcript_14338/m.33378 type:complete len:256 (+) Transcript_14338:83-850(+)
MEPFRCVHGIEEALAAAATEPRIGLVRERHGRRQRRPAFGPGIPPEKLPGFLRAPRHERGRLEGHRRHGRRRRNGLHRLRPERRGPAGFGAGEAQPAAGRAERRNDPADHGVPRDRGARRRGGPLQRRGRDDGVGRGPHREDRLRRRVRDRRAGRRRGKAQQREGPADGAGRSGAGPRGRRHRGAEHHVAVHGPAAHPRNDLRRAPARSLEDATVPRRSFRSRGSPRIRPPVEPLPRAAMVGLISSTAHRSAPQR